MSVAPETALAALRAGYGAVQLGVPGWSAAQLLGGPMDPAGRRGGRGRRVLQPPDGQDRAAGRLGGHRGQRPAGHLPARPGIAQKPGGWSNARYNIEMGPPVLAPLLVTMVGGMGLLAAILRREQ